MEKLREDYTENSLRLLVWLMGVLNVKKSPSF